MMPWTEPDPITWKGYWPDDTPEDRVEQEPWETYELIALGREAGDMRNVTLDDLKDVFKQNPQFPMRLIPDNAETVERIAETICRIDNQTGPEVAVEGIPCDLHRSVAASVLAALDGETP